MRKNNKAISLGKVYYTLLVGAILFYSFDTHSRADNAVRFLSATIKNIGHTKSKELPTLAVFRTNPEFYKLNTILSDGPKVHFKKPLEQDLYFFFGPYIKDTTTRVKSQNLEFNKVLRDLFKYHFN